MLHNPVFRLLTFCSLLCVYGARAQVAATTGFRPGPAIGNFKPGQSPLLSSMTGGLIKLNVVVSDVHDRPVGGLLPDDLTLLDNGVPSSIVTFEQHGSLSSEPDANVKVILVIDEIQLPASLISHERSSVAAFLRQNNGHLAHPVTLFSLVDTGLWLVGASPSDGNMLAARIMHGSVAGLVRPSRGSQRGTLPSSMGFADPPAQQALQALGKIAAAEREETGRKLLLWVGPGWGLGSGSYAEGTSSKDDTFYTIRWFSTLLREAGIALYSFSVGEEDGLALLYKASLKGVASAHDASFMDLHRKVLAVQSGGRVLSRDNDLLRQLNSCMQDADTFYSLSIQPSHAEHIDEFHSLQIQVNKPGLTARTNIGYYDQPYYSDPADPNLKLISTQQLQSMLNSLQGEADAHVARQLSGLALSERLDQSQRLSLAAGLHGEKTRRAFTALADASEFLSPARSELPPADPPDETAQSHMISKAADYLDRTIPQLPNFVAGRTTVLYQATPPLAEGETRMDYEPLHVASTSKETVLYRNGQETAESHSAKHKKPKDPDLTTYGTFGPVLSFVHNAIAFPGALTFSRWEDGEDGRYAVFHYEIPAAGSLNQVYGCCLPDGDGKQSFQSHTAYHGEITMNPATGAIIRLMAISELNGFLPVSQSEILVEYGKVTIGGKLYICPVRSVSMMRMRSVVTLREWDESFRTYGPYTTMLNDISYDNYHVFRGESRILPDYQPAQSQ